MTVAFEHLTPPTAGQPITMGPRGLNVPDNPIIPFIEGDGTGPDIWRASVRVLDAAVQKAYGGRRKIAWFVASLGIALSPILIAVLLTPLIPALTSPVWRARVGAIVYIALASMVPTTAYAVAVSQVMDLHLVIRRTLQYGLAKTPVWCAILLPLLYLVFDIYNNRSLRVEEYLTLRRPFEPVLLSVVSFGILTFRHHILRYVDRWFRRDASDHTESLARLEQGIRSARTIRDISTVLKREIERAVHPSSIAVLMVDSEGEGLVSLESQVPPLRHGRSRMLRHKRAAAATRRSHRANPPGEFLRSVA